MSSKDSLRAKTDFLAKLIRKKYAFQYQVACVLPASVAVSVQRETPQKEHGPRDRDPPRMNMGSGSQTGSDIIQRPPLDRMTETCKNITLPQTSFAGDKNKIMFLLQDWGYRLCRIAERSERAFGKPDCWKHRYSTSRNVSLSTSSYWKT